MIHDNLLLIISLLFVVSMLTMLSEKVRISYPIFLVIGGLAISFIPGIPHIELEPDWVFLIFLPPLLYGAAWNTSWTDFWKFRRPIILLSVGLVVFTATAVAFLAEAIIPEFTLAMGFLLGGIISPPDAVAATSVLHGLKVPKRVVTILEGESLLNDASSLIVFRVALATMGSGSFVFWQAGLDFLSVSLIGLLVGLVIAHIMYVVHRFFPTTPSIDAAFTVISPYLMYIAAEHFKGSGVLAVVAGGLFLSFRSHEIFTYNSRMQTNYVWDTITFLLNGFVFILIGLQLPDVINGLGSYTIREAIGYGLIISLLTIVVRIIWVFPGTFLPRLLSKKVRESESAPSWQSVFIVAWSGMRGVVSLAAALAVPLTLQENAFPDRDLILFITFVVILVTLVAQGMSLPLIIRVLKIKEDGENVKEQNTQINLALATVSLDYMSSAYEGEIIDFHPFAALKERYERIVSTAEARLRENAPDEPIFEHIKTYRRMLLEIVNVKRTELQKLRRDKNFSDELLRSKERELDLEEARLRDSP